MDGWDLQHKLVDELKRDDSASDALILLEHRPVYTLGTVSRLQNVLFPVDKANIPRRTDIEQQQQQQQKGHGDSTRSSSQTPSSSDPHEQEIDIFRTERGGEVTYHGPGQLVLYPIINLRRHKTDLHWYIRNLEQVVIDLLQQEYGLSSAGRKEGLTGVWVDDEKVCAIGLKVSKWITMHGLALNVRMSDRDLSPFARIIPCGIHQFQVNSLHRVVSRDNQADVSIQCTGDLLVKAFDRIFGPFQFERTSLDGTKSELSGEQNKSTDAFHVSASTKSTDALNPSVGTSSNVTQLVHSLTASASASASSLKKS